MSRGLHLLGAATDSASAYEADAYADGRRHYSENPNAAGHTDEYGRFVITEVPGWHLFNSYYDWFRRGFADAKRGTAVGADPTKTAGAVFSALAEGLAQGATKQRAPGSAVSSYAPQPPPAAPPPAAPPPPATKKGFWTDPLIGPIPGWGVVGGGGVLAVLVALLARSR